MSKYLLKTFSWLFIITFGIRIVDVIKNLFIASKIGVSDVSDIYLSLIAIPDSILILIGFDTIKGVVNSEYSSLSPKSDFLKSSFKSLFTYIFIASFILVVLLLLFKESVINFLLPGFSLPKKDIALNLAILIFPILFFKGINSLFSAFYNSARRFYFPVATQLIITLCIVVSIFLPQFNNQLIYNISLGLFFGNLLYSLLLLIPIIKDFGIKLVEFKLNDLSRKIFKNCFSLITLVIFNQIYISSRNFLTSYFPDGSLSALNYASSVTNFISALTFSIVFSVLLSTFASSFSIGERIKVKLNFRNTLNYLLYIYILIVILFISFDREILSLLFLRGKFDMQGIDITLKPFFWETLALIPFLFSIIPTTLFLAKKEYRKLTIIGISVYVIGIFLNVFFTKLVGFYGVSIAAFTVYVIHGFLLIKYSRLFIGKYKNEDIILAGKLIFSGLLTYFILSLLKGNFEAFNFYSLESLQRLYYLSVAFLVTSLIYLVITSILRVNLLKNFKKIF